MTTRSGISGFFEGEPVCIVVGTGFSQRIQVESFAEGKWLGEQNDSIN
jgi:hypothetical protein